MPDYAEMDEFIIKCSFEWTTVNGTSGYKATGPNGNSIFLPAAGCYFGRNLQDAGTVGNYWIPSLYNEADVVRMLVLSENGVSNETTFTRPLGLSVRPVCD